MAWYFRKSFRPHEAERTTPFFEHWVKKNSQTAWKFDIITGVPKPSCSEFFRGISTGKEGWFYDSDSRWSSIWPFQLSCNTLPGMIVSLSYSSQCFETNKSTSKTTLYSIEYPSAVAVSQQMHSNSPSHRPSNLSSRHLLPRFPRIREALPILQMMSPSLRILWHSTQS